MGSPATIPQAVQRLHGLFIEAPGTQLTLLEASRLTGLERDICEHVLSALEAAHFLKLGRDGRYQRWSRETRHHSRPNLLPPVSE